MAEVSKQKFGKGKNIDFDIMGCGYTEALYAMVDNVMVEQKPIQKSINIETIGWGKHGKLVIGEVEGFLAKAGITINSHFPSTSYAKSILKYSKEAKMGQEDEGKVRDSILANQHHWKIFWLRWYMQFLYGCGKRVRYSFGNGGAC
jgi:hypothetical protein